MSDFRIVRDYPHPPQEVGLPAVLNDLGEDGTLRPTSTLTPKSFG